MGTFVIVYHETDRPFGEVAASMAKSDHPLDKAFIEGIKDVHGFDATQPPPASPPSCSPTGRRHTERAQARPRVLRPAHAWCDRQDARLRQGGLRDAPRRAGRCPPAPGTEPRTRHPEPHPDG